MTNTFTTGDPYNKYIYAQESLIQLQNALGMAARIHRGFDREYRTYEEGDTIKIRRPQTFTAQSAPGSATALAPTKIELTLDQHQEVRFEITDKEMAFGPQYIIEDHLAPAMYALADKVDTDCAALYKYIPWFFDNTGAITDVTGTKKVLFDNKVPMKKPGDLFFMIDGTMQAALEGLVNFTAYNVGGEAALRQQEKALMDIQKFGFNFFANQNVAAHTAGAIADAAGEVDGAHAAGVEEITIDALTDTQDVNAGDSFVIAGNTQRYSILEDATVSGSEITVAIFPALVEAQSGSEVVTIRADTHSANLAYHRNAFAIAFGKLPDQAIADLGPKVATVQDPITGVSVRLVFAYDVVNLKTIIVADTLFGVKCLDANLACRACGA